MVDRRYRCIRWSYVYSLGWGFFIPRSLWNVSGFLHYRWWWYVRSRYTILSMLHFVWCYIRPWQHLSKLTTQLKLVPPLSLCLRGVFIFGLLTQHLHCIQVKASDKETHAFHQVAIRCRNHFPGNGHGKDMEKTQVVKPEEHVDSNMTWCERLWGESGKIGDLYWYCILICEDIYLLSTEQSPPKYLNYWMTAKLNYGAPFNVAFDPPNTKLT